MSREIISVLVRLTGASPERNEEDREEEEG